MRYLVDDTRMTAIADAIRSKTETTDVMTVDEMPEKILSITTKNLGPETITGTIDFFNPYNPYDFYYEDGNGIIQHYNTRDASYIDGIPVDFIIRKNSMITLHCPKFATGSVHGAGLTSDILEAANGVEILQNTVYGNSRFIIDAICKVSDNFNLSWCKEEDLPG